MVRFKGAQLSRAFEGIFVSIPLWCDLKSAAWDRLAAAEPCFHPTMVRFKDAENARDWLISCGFHPTMVRFKGD